MPQSGKFSRTAAALAALVWDQHVMWDFRDRRCPLIRMAFNPPLTLKEASELYFGEEPPHIAPVDVILFELCPVEVAGEMWMYLTADGVAVVPPFPWRGYARIPLTEKELEQCLRFR